MPRVREKGMESGKAGIANDSLSLVLTSELSYITLFQMNGTVLLTCSISIALDYVVREQSRDAVVLISLWQVRTECCDRDSAAYRRSAAWRLLVTSC